MVRAPRIFSRRRVWLNRCHSFARVSDCEKGEDEANGGRNDCQRAPVNEPIGPVIKGETTVRPRGNVDQRNQTALRKDGKVAPIDLRAIAWKKRARDCDQGWPISIGRSEERRVGKECRSGRWKV